MPLFAKPIVNVVRVTANPGKEDALRDVILRSAGRALASPGNRGFVAYRSIDHAADFLIVEHWRSRRQHRRHKADPAVLAMFGEVAGAQIIATGPDDTEWADLT